jgi:hypothetical protein
MALGIIVQKITILSGSFPELVLWFFNAEPVPGLYRKPWYLRHLDLVQKNLCSCLQGNYFFVKITLAGKN